MEVVLVLSLFCVALRFLLRGVFVLVFFTPLWHCDHLAWGRESWSICFLCTCLSCMRSCLFSSFSLCQGLAAAYDCGTPWIVLTLIPSVLATLTLQVTEPATLVNVNAPVVAKTHFRTRAGENAVPM